MIKILLGGSPCTYWSIAKTQNRETTPSGLGWELFENYLIAKEKFQPDVFIYENNQSAATAIKEEIRNRFGCDEEPNSPKYIEIDSALVSAQSRKRFYVHNCGDVRQPADRGILLRDIIENGVVEREKAYCLTRHEGNTRDYFQKRQTNLVFSPVRIGTIENEAKNKGHDSKQYRVYSVDGKATTLCGEGGGLGAKTGLYACPIDQSQAEILKASGGIKPRSPGAPTPVYEVKDGQILIRGQKYPINLQDGYYIIRKLTVKECCRLQTMPDDYMSARIEKVKEIVLKCKDVPTQIVTIPLRTEKRGCVINTTFDLKEMGAQNLKDRRLTPHCLALSRDVIGIDKHIWDIVLCIIKDLQEKGRHDYLEAIMNMCRVMMSTDLSIEKLPKECLDENLKREKSSTILTLIKKIIAKITSMFVPQKNTPVCIENCAESCSSISPTSLTLGILYSTGKNMRLVSNNACYKGLGNGWTAEVIIHILNGALQNVPRDEKLLVLSLYDGIGTGRYCLDKMGFTNIEYHSFEIDKYAMQIAQSNYPDIIQHGDAFQARDESFALCGNVGG